MKKILIAGLIATSILSLAGNVEAGSNKKAHRLAPEWVCPLDCIKPKKKVVKTHTVELCRRGFTKWEEHCCGIKMKANYIKVTYETFYCNGTSAVWHKEYRS